MPVAYTSHVRVERVRGPQRIAYLPGNEEPTHFGVHGAIAEHYKVPKDAFPPCATTLDHVVAAAAG